MVVRRTEDVAAYLLERLSARLSPRDGPSAHQLYLAHKKRTVADLAVCLPGEVFTNRMGFGAWCATKPVLAMAVCASVEQHGGSLDTALVELLPPDLRPAVPVTLADLLTHSLYLPSPSMFEAMLMPKTVRWLSVRDALLSPAVAQRGQYSEYVWSRVVGEILMHLEHCAPARAVSRFLAEMGLERGFCFPSAGTDRSRAAERSAPVLWSTARRLVGTTESTSPHGFDVVATGGLATARGLGALYETVASINSGQVVAPPISKEMVGSMLSRRRGRCEEITYRRTASSNGRCTVPGMMPGLSPSPDRWRTQDARNTVVVARS